MLTMLCSVSLMPDKADIVMYLMVSVAKQVILERPSVKNHRQSRLNTFIRDRLTFNQFRNRLNTWLHREA